MVTQPAFDPWVAALGNTPSVDRANASAKQAAQQFEALLIRQFLSNARSTSWLSDQQESESGWREIADDSLAGYLVKAGGLGLSKQVESLISQAQGSRFASQAAKKTAPATLALTGKSLNALDVPSVNSTIDTGSLLAPDFVKSK